MSSKRNNYSVNFETNDDNNPYLIPSSTAVHVEPIESRNSRSTRSYQSVKSTVRYSYNELCRETFNIIYFPIIVLISITIWIIKLTTTSVINIPLAIGLAIFIALNLSSALGIIFIHHSNNNTNNNSDTNTQTPTRIESILKNNIHILEIIYITMGVLSSCLLYISSSIITKDNNYVTYDSSSYSDLIFLTISPLIYFSVSATPYLIPVLIAWCMSFATAMGALPHNDDRVFIIFTMLFILFTILYVYQQKQSYYTIINMLQTQAQQSHTPQPQSPLQYSIHGSTNGTGTRSRLPGNRLIGQNSGRNIPGSALSDGGGEGRDYDSIIGDTGTMYIDTNNNNNINNNHTNDEDDGSDIQQQHNNKTQSDLLKQIISNISHDMISPLQALEMGLETMYMTLIERLNRPGSLKNSRLMPLKFPLSNKSANDNNNYNNISSNSNLYASNKSGLSTPSYKEHVRDMYWDPSMSQKQSQQQQQQQQQQVYTLNTPHTPLSSSANNQQYPLNSSKNQQQLNSSKNQRAGFNLSLDTNLLLPTNNTTNNNNNNNTNNNTNNVTYTNQLSPSHVDYYYGNNIDTFSPIGASSAARNPGYGMSSLYESQQLEIVQTMRSTLSFMAMIIDRSLDASKCTGGVQLLPNVEMFDAKESISKV